MSEKVNLELSIKKHVQSTVEMKENLLSLKEILAR